MPRRMPIGPAMVEINGRVYRVPQHTLVDRAGLELERAGRAWLDAVEPSARIDGRLARALRHWFELTGRL